MDNEALVVEIDKFLGIVNQMVLYWDNMSVSDQAVREQRNDALRQRLPSVRSITEVLLPEVLSEVAEYDGQFQTHAWQRARSALLQVKGKLVSAERIARMLGPDGPRLQATSMHPLIWNAAVSLWDSGHFAQAAQPAATALEGHLQAAGERFDLSGTDLAQLFSLKDASEESPRLRFPDIKEDSDAFRSEHEGAAALVRGAMMSIRNGASHDRPTEPTEDEALEALATLSYVARLVDRADRVTS